MDREKEIVFIHFPLIDSTSTWAKENGSKLDPKKITCIFADAQTQGRGSFNRLWHSPNEGNIYASLFFTVPNQSPFLSNLGQILIYSAALTLQQLHFQPRIKWPNDLFLSGKKVAGVLGEAVALDSRQGIILGLGLNVNMSLKSLLQVDQKATSLAEESGQHWDPQDILEKIVVQFSKNLIVLQAEGFSPFQKRFQELLLYVNEPISVRSAQHTIQGICQGMSAQGELEIKIGSGEKIRLISGQITTD